MEEGSDFRQGDISRNPDCDLCRVPWWRPAPVVPEPRVKTETSFLSVSGIGMRLPAIANRRRPGRGKTPGFSDPGKP